MLSVGKVGIAAEGNDDTTIRRDEEAPEDRNPLGQIIWP